MESKFWSDLELVAACKYLCEWGRSNREGAKRHTEQG